MSRIANHIVMLYTWFSSHPMSERERTQRQIMGTFADVRFHTPGI